MQPLQYDLRCSAAKDSSITHAAAAPSILDAAITMRSAETELQSTIELRDKMKPTNPNAHTYVNGTDVKTHGYAVTHNTFLQ